MLAPAAAGDHEGLVLEFNKEGRGQRTKGMGRKDRERVVVFFNS